MINIDIQTGFVAYLTFMLATAMLIGLYEAWHDRVHEWKLPEEQLCQCADCHCAFVVHRYSRTARCPRCNKLCTLPTKH